MRNSNEVKRLFRRVYTPKVRAGIAKEESLTLQPGRSLYILGNFGECVKHTMKFLDLVKSLYDPTRFSSEGHEAFIT